MNIIPAITFNRLTASQQLAALQPAKTAAQERMEHANYIRLARMWEAQDKRKHNILAEQERIFGGIFDESVNW